MYWSRVAETGGGFLGVMVHVHGEVVEGVRGKVVVEAHEHEGGSGGLTSYWLVRGSSLTRKVETGDAPSHRTQRKIDVNARQRTLSKVVRHILKAKVVFTT